MVVYDEVMTTPSPSLELFVNQLVAEKGITARKHEEMVALIAYLKCLGLNVEKAANPQR